MPDLGDHDAPRWLLTMGDIRNRLGTVAGSGIVVFSLWFFSAHGSFLLLAAVLGLALATLPIVRRLHVGYVEALQQGLRDAANKLEVATAEEPTRLTEAPGREGLIQRIEELQPGGLSALLQVGLDPDVAAKSQREPLLDPESALKTARDLLSRDAERVAQGLERLDPRGAEVPCALFLLTTDEFQQQATRALRKLAPAIVGQLIDVLLNPETDFVVRRRIPRLLRHCPTQRAAEGLLLGIGDARFEVRYECGRALLHLTGENSEIVISQQKAIQVIQREVAEGKRILENLDAQLEEDGDDIQSSLVDGLVRDRVDRSLEHVFTVLCLHMEREPLRLAFRALHHEDTNYRGTALEYLDTVLPLEIRDLIWPLLSESVPLPSARPADELLADLAFAARSR